MSQVIKRKKRRTRKKRSAKSTDRLEPYHIRYRPRELKEVVGQESVTKSLQSLLDSKSQPHSYLFTGPSGVGKTTLARIIGMHCGVSKHNVLEIDAATHSGVDTMKALKSAAETRGFGDRHKLVILDECHSLSKQAWQSWLKIVEEPPEHLYLVFCTTESSKVPRTIKTRCQHFDLKSVPVKQIEQVLDEVCFSEQILLDVGSAALRVIASRADGSVRQALVNLQSVAHCKTKDEIMSVLDSATDEQDLAFEIVRAIVNNTPFMKVKDMIGKLETDNCEGIRIIVVNYAAKALLGSKSKDKAGWLLEVLEEFSEPWNPSEKKAPLLLAAGRLLF